MLTDTHVHLDLADYASDLPLVLARSRAAGVVRWIVPAIDSVSWSHLLEMHQQQPALYYALGLHPWFLQAEPESALAQLERVLRSTPEGLVAIGECGLDGAIDVPMTLQLHYLEHQLQLACELELPLILHCRRAHNELLAQLGHFRPARGGVIHGFSGSRQQAEHYWALGFYLGVGGVITYERAQNSRKAIAAMPFAALLLETDGPTMPLSGYQGERNEPARVVQVLGALAQLRNEPEGELAAQIERNVARLFSLPVLC